MVVVPEAGDDGPGRSLPGRVSVGRIVRDIGVEDGVGILTDLDESQVVGVLLRALCSHFPHDDVVGVPAVAVEGLGLRVVAHGVVADGPVGRVGVEDDAGPHRLCGVEVVVHVVFKSGVQAVGPVVAQHHDISRADVQQDGRELALLVVGAEVAAAGSLVGEFAQLGQGREVGAEDPLQAPGPRPVAGRG